MTKQVKILGIALSIMVIIVGSIFLYLYNQHKEERAIYDSFVSNFDGFSTLDHFIPLEFDDLGEEQIVTFTNGEQYVLTGKKSDFEEESLLIYNLPGGSGDDVSNESINFQMLVCDQDILGRTYCDIGNSPHPLRDTYQMLDDGVESCISIDLNDRLDMQGSCYASIFDDYMLLNDTWTPGSSLRKEGDRERILLINPYLPAGGRNSGMKLSIQTL